MVQGKFKAACRSQDISRQFTSLFSQNGIRRMIAESREDDEFEQ
jgi:hypothetical protein